MLLWTQKYCICICVTFFSFEVSCFATKFIGLGLKWYKSGCWFFWYLFSWKVLNIYPEVWMGTLRRVLFWKRRLVLLITTTTTESSTSRDQWEYQSSKTLFTFVSKTVKIYKCSSVTVIITGLIYGMLKSTFRRRQHPRHSRHCRQRLRRSTLRSRHTCRHCRPRTVTVTESLSAHRRDSRTPVSCRPVVTDRMTEPSTA